MARTCSNCGALNAACCAGNICQTGGVCTGAANGMPGTCDACGGQGQPCCGGTTTCHTGLSCLGAGGGGNGGTCDVCGAGGQACCPGNMCAVGFACVRGAGADGGLGALSCNACGASGQRCCGAACNPGLTCSGGNAGTCS
jgi:hypothetical protein